MLTFLFELTLSRVKKWFGQILQVMIIYTGLTTKTSIVCVHMKCVCTSKQIYKPPRDIVHNANEADELSDEDDTEDQDLDEYDLAMGQGYSDKKYELRNEME